MISLAEDTPISFTDERVTCCTGVHVDTSDVMDVPWKLCTCQLPVCSVQRKVNQVLAPGAGASLAYVLTLQASGLGRHISKVN